MCVHTNAEPIITSYCLFIRERAGKASLSEVFKNSSYSNEKFSEALVGKEERRATQE